jgi:hypothetical protein
VTHAWAKQGWNSQDVWGLGVGALMMYETRAAGAEGAGGRRAERQEATENTGPPASRQACR